MPPVARTLEACDNRVLREVIAQLSDGQLERFGDESVNRDHVFQGALVLNRAVVAVIVVGRGDEAASMSGMEIFLPVNNQGPAYLDTRSVIFGSRLIGSSTVPSSNGSTTA